MKWIEFYLAIIDKLYLTQSNLPDSMLFLASTNFLPTTASKNLRNPKNNIQLVHSWSFKQIFLYTILTLSWILVCYFKIRERVTRNCTVSQHLVLVRRSGWIASQEYCAASSWREDHSYCYRGSAISNQFNRELTAAPAFPLKMLRDPP